VELKAMVAGISRAHLGGARGRTWASRGDAPHADMGAHGGGGGPGRVAAAVGWRAARPR
jgi:hypothetical protein